MVSFTLFLVLGVWLLQQQAMLPDFAYSWLLLIYPLLLIKKIRFTRFMLTALFACGLGFYHAAWQAEQRLAASLNPDWQGRDIQVIGVIAELPHRHQGGQRFVFDVEQTLTPEVQVPAHVYLSTYYDKQNRPPELKAGERWQLSLRLKQPHGASNPYGYDFELWALERNLRAVGYVHNKGINLRLDPLAKGMGYRIETWREAIHDKIFDTLGSAPFAGVLSALVIGDQYSISNQQWQVFTRTGVNHLMSISGLHITMLAGIGFALCYHAWRRSTRLTLYLPARRAAVLAAILAALGYALLSGFAVPAQRTVYMVGAVAAALWLNRNFAPSQILCIALLAVLLPDPWAILSAGFWLSFGAVALILYISANRISKRHWLAEYTHVQWAMSIGLIPMLLGLFQQVSIVSPLANAIAIPLVSLVVVPLALLGAVLPLEAPLWLAHIAMDGVMQVLEWLNALPLAVWNQHAPPAWSIAIGMLGILWILLPRGFPARYLGFLLLLPLFLNKPEPPAENALRLLIFDVGQGLAVAALTHEHALLYDTGPDFSGESDSGNRILIPGFRALGITRLDGLILSHDDIDHTGGAGSVLQMIPVDWIATSLPVNQLETVSIDPALYDTKRCHDHQSWLWDGVRFEILHPAADSISKPHDNEQSCVLRISIGSYSILLVGDIAKNAEMRLIKLHADKLYSTVLVAPHHGSKSSSSLEFVAATLPDYVVFTAGYRNRFGHPKPEVLRRYQDSGAILLRSDFDGAILLDMDAQGLQLQAYRKTHRRYWTH